MASFTITPLTARTGVEVIGLDFTQPIDTDTGAHLRRAFAEHHVLVCGLAGVRVGELASLLPRSRWVELQAGEDKNLAQRYCECALGCLEKLQSILRSRPAGKVLVQVVVEDAGEQAVLAGLAGLLKTAWLENPQIVGQLVLVPAGTTAGELAEWLGAEKGRSNSGLRMP